MSHKIDSDIQKWYKQIVIGKLSLLSILSYLFTFKTMKWRKSAPGEAVLGSTILSVALAKILGGDAKAAEKVDRGDLEALNNQNKIAKVLSVDSISGKETKKTVDYPTFDLGSGKYLSSKYVQWIDEKDIPLDYDYVKAEQAKEKAAWRTIRKMISPRFTVIRAYDATVDKFKEGAYGLKNFQNALEAFPHDLTGLNGFLNGYDENGDGKVQPLFKTMVVDGKEVQQSIDGSDIAGIDWHISNIKETIALPDNDQAWSAKLDNVREQQIAYLEDIKELVTDARNSIKSLQSEFQYIVDNWDNIILVRKTNANGSISEADLEKLSMAEWNKIRGQVQSYSMSQDINKEKGYSVATRE